MVVSTSRVQKPQPIDVESFPKNKRSDFYLPLYEHATGQAVKVPFIVARGAKPGPVLGISAAVHGNELNGIIIIQHLIDSLDLSQLEGTLLCAPVVNVPAFDAGERFFSDGRDLNNHFPGKDGGTPSEQYARSFSHTFLPAIDYLVDIHTASEGRLNTLYVRADMLSAKTQQLAETFNPNIILHIKGSDGTLRNAARRKKIPAITIEAGNPNVIQGRMIFDGEVGIENIMCDLGMVSGELKLSRETVICNSSQWLRTTGGGILETQFRLGEHVEKQQLLAKTSDPFGNVLRSYHAPHDGIVIGKAAYPVAIPGTRFCHLGRIGEPERKTID